MVRIGINGFGRTARTVLRAINKFYPEKLEVVAINGRAAPEIYAHLLCWDSNYGRYPGEVKAGKESIWVDGKEIRVYREEEPAKIPWDEVGAQIVIESTGAFTDAHKASAHFKEGVKKVVITAPAKNEDITIVLGVNEEKYIPEKHHIISGASCTTNCIAPVVKVLHENFRIIKGFLSTIHAYTNDQKLLDGHHEDLRRARAAALNIAPTTTGAAKAVALVIPELKGKLHGIAFRVPVSTVSLCDFVGELSREVSVEEVNQAFLKASQGKLKGILEYCQEELVSTDFKGNPASAILDAPSTMVIGGNMVKVLAWYDNEWGYSCRIADLAAYIAGQGL